MYKHSSQKCSNQQKYVYNIVSGELNYPVSNCSLDIAFPDEMIYLECDFSGHWMSVKMGAMTQKEFDKKERNRWYALYNRKWREIRIISRNDLVPENEVLLRMIQEAKEYLNTGHSYIRYDIDNKTVKCSQYEKEYDFGKLKRIYSYTKIESA